MTTVLGLARPWCLALLALLPLWALWRHRQRRRAEVPFAPAQLAGARGTWTRRLATWASPGTELALVGLSVLALAGPYREARLELTDDSGIDIMLALDVSLSMLAEDFEPNRLAALRTIARDLIATGGGNRMGLVVFAGDAYVQTPLVTDRQSLLELLDGVTVHALSQRESSGTAIGDALLVAGERLVKSKVPGRDQSLVLITDGESNDGIEPVLAARWIAEQDIRLHAIGIGGTEPVEVFFEGRPVGGENRYLAVLDDAELERVAQASGGVFHRATDTGTLARIFDELSRLEHGPLESRVAVERADLSSLLAVVLLALFASHLAVDGIWLRRPYR